MRAKSLQMLPEAGADLAVVCCQSIAIDTTVLQQLLKERLAVFTWVSDGKCKATWEGWLSNLLLCNAALAR